MQEDRKPSIDRDAIRFKSVKFFVCTCPHCYKKQEVFPNEIHKAYLCRHCGKDMDLDTCSFEVP